MVQPLWARHRSKQEEFWLILAQVFLLPYLALDRLAGEYSVGAGVLEATDWSFDEVTPHKQQSLENSNMG